MSEKRVDPDDGCSYTYEELKAYYKGKFKNKAIDAYWEQTCTPVKKGKKAKAAAKESAGKKKKDSAPKSKKAVQAENKKVSKELSKAALGNALDKVAKQEKAKAKEAKSNFKVCVCGGAGGIGQPLSLLMVQDASVSELNVFDLNVAMVPPMGVAADLNHIEKKCKVTGYVMDVGEKPIDKLEECLTGCHLVLVPAGMPRKPGQTRDDLFKINADIAKGIVDACAKFCPTAVLALIVNPVNSIVPAMAELYKKKGLDHTKIVGVTTLDIVRANKMVGTLLGKNPNSVRIPVVGGHAGETILPLFSQDKHGKSIPADKVEQLDKDVQDAGTVVVEAKGGKGSATLSMAYAGARLGKAVLRGLSGRRSVECAYVASDEFEGLPYFASKVVFGEKGVKKVLPVGEINEYEKKRLERVKEVLKAEVETGVAYAKANDLS